MSEEERELHRRLAPGPAPRPPEGLLEKLKADIPARLPSNVRPFRPRLPVMALRIAATLFVAGGVLFVVTHGSREEIHPLEPRAIVPVAQEPSSPVPQKAKDELSERREKNVASPRPAPAKKAFAPSMPSADSVPQEPAVGGLEAPVASEKEEAAPEEMKAAPPPPAPMGALEKKKSESMSRTLQAASSGAVKSARPAAAARAVAPTAGSLLGEVLLRFAPPAAARDGDRVLVLLSLSDAEGAELSGEGPLHVLSAAGLGGGIVVLAETRGQGGDVELLSRGGRTSAGSVAPSLSEASVELRLAVLAFRLERARAGGDGEARAAVAREAAALERLDARATKLVRLAER